MRPKLWVGVNLARLWAARAERDKAFELLEPIFNRFSEGFQTRDLVAAANLLQRFSLMQAIVSGSGNGNRVTYSTDRERLEVVLRTRRSVSRPPCRTSGACSPGQHCGRTRPWAPPTPSTRTFTPCAATRGQIDTGAAFRRLLKNSEIREGHVEGGERMQDPYSSVASRRW